MSHPRDQFIDVGGIRTRYWRAGDTGSAVVLLHGIGCSVLEWKHNIDVLAARHRVFAVDLLGFGLTDKPVDEDYRLDRHARFVTDFLSAVGVDRAHFAGNSLGGRLALQCAIATPDRVASMVLVDPAGVGGRDTLFEFRLAAVPHLGEVVTHASHMGTRMLWNKAFHDPKPFVTDELVATKTAFARLPGAQSAFLRTLRDFVGFGGFKPERIAELHAALPQVTAPALVIWGLEDRFVSQAHAEPLCRLLPDAERVVFERCGHVPQIEKAAEFNEAVLKFLARVEAA